MTEERETIRFIRQPDADDVAHGGEVIEHRSARKRRGRGAARLTLNLTTMIDVTFLLLVYFLVATKFKTGEEVYQLDLPRDLQSDLQRDPFDLDERPLVIRVASRGEGLSQYEVTIEGPIPDPATFEELYTLLRNTQITDEGTATRPMFFPDHPIVIRPARTATWDHAVACFNAAARARYTNVMFAKPE